MAHNGMPAPPEERQDLYERDYYTWVVEQARALKQRRIEMLDWQNLAEEVEDLGRSEKRELRSRLEVARRANRHEREAYRLACAQQL